MYIASNRSEWELRGESIVEEMLSDFEKQHDAKENEEHEAENENDD